MRKGNGVAPTQSTQRERLHKFMARCGVASRRACEALIAEGRVSVNGEVVTFPGVTIDAAQDLVMVDGQVLRPQEERVYIMLNKPPGYVTTLSDTHGRPTVRELVGGVRERIYPVGRLDMDTSGLLLLTNDGELAFRLTHPRFEVEKTYEAIVEGVPTREELERLRHGVLLEGRMTAPAKVRLLKVADGHASLSITIHEGRKREVRQMCAAIGHRVIALKRVSLGPLRLKGLKEGEFRYLTEDEINSLFQVVGLMRERGR